MSRDLQALEDAEADAEGKVRVAETRLHELREAGEKPTSSKTVAAEEQLAAAVRRLQRSRDATVAEAGKPPPEPEPAGDSDRIPADRPMQYTNAVDWLEQYLLRIWRRSDVRWCAKWYLHGEALTRVEALWRSWEHLRYEGPLGMAIWWRDYADYHLRELTASTGPFARCRATTGDHEQVPPLATEPAPAELRTPSAPPL